MLYVPGPIFTPSFYYSCRISIPGASYSYTRVADFLGIEGMLLILIYDSPFFKGLLFNPLFYFFLTSSSIPLLLFKNTFFNPRSTIIKIVSRPWGSFFETVYFIESLLFAKCRVIICLFVKFITHGVTNIIRCVIPRRGIKIIIVV